MNIGKSNVGLTSEEAAKRLVEDGANVTDEGKKVGFVKMFLSQFCDLMIVILLAAAVLSFVVAIVGGQTGEIVEPIIIVVIVFVNATLGALQEYRAEKSLCALKKLTSPKTKVVRDGEVILCDSTELVRGDYCLFDLGEIVTADCRVAACENVYLDESALTGESVPVEKVAVSLGSVGGYSSSNTIYSGSFVTKGKCAGVVYATGKNSELGKIAALLSGKEATLTPLQQRLKRLGKLIGIVCLAVCVAVLIIGFVKGVANMQEGDTLTKVFVDVFLTSVSLAVAAIPEGLPAVVTVVLAKGIESMAHKNAIVKRLTAVEALGSATVICTDKTGTLTQNKMTLYGVFDGKRLVGSQHLAEVSDLVNWFAACSDVSVDGQGQLLGDPTEIAVTRHADKTVKYSRLYEIAFDSTRKMMTVVVKKGGDFFVVTKGSLDAMRSAKNHTEYEQTCRLYSKRGFRVLALSVKKVDGNFPRSARLERDFDLRALFVIADPPREEAYEAVEICLGAGIRPVMITGDGVATATEIATNLGIMRAGDIAVDGETLASWNKEELADNVDKVAVYARVTPADKLRIVEAWQSRGAVVAMTGDGVNDAPALKRADIGCAMGSGTEVAKNAADMILAADNFATVVDAVSLGRSVYENIKKSVCYLMTCNIGEVLCVFFALLLWDVPLLSAMQLLWVNLVTDGLPGLALGVYRQERDVMNLPPKGKQESFFSNGGGKRVVVGGILFGASTLVGYSLGRVVDQTHASTAAFLVLSLSQLFFALEMRSRKGIFDRDITPFMVVSIAVSFALVAAVAFVPTVGKVFELTILPLWLYAVVLALSLVPTLACEAARLVLRVKNRVGRQLRAKSSKNISSFS